MRPPHTPPLPPRFGGAREAPLPRSSTPAAPGPPASRVRRDSRPSAAPAGPSSWCPGARRQVSTSQVSGRKWRPGPARTKEQEAGGGRGREGASEATGGSAAPPPPAQAAPRAPNPAPRQAPARSADPPGGPAPYLGRAPRSSLKGQCPRRRPATLRASHSTSPSSRSPDGPALGDLAASGSV